MENYNRSRPKMSQELSRYSAFVNSSAATCLGVHGLGVFLLAAPWYNFLGERYSKILKSEIPLSLLLSNLVSCFRAYVGPIVCDQETTWVSRGLAERPPDKVSAQHRLDFIWLIVHKIIKVGYSLLGGGFDSHNSNVVWHDHCRGLGK